ncbi:hypothetical protein FIM12_01800 [SAR202 cluster bacterium AD-804-J14_MRT_500m]|nr:hypothetical protein [SAR202 cluster bacterium AD-804-J14_MRT_500m]
MNVTKTHKLSQNGHSTGLTVTQLNAIDVLAQGKTDQETATVVGVSRESVSRWKNHNPNFIAELNKQRRLIWGASHDRLRSLLPKAIDTLETALERGDSKVAMELLKAAGIYGQIKPPSGSTDPEMVLWEEAIEWAKTELLKQGPSAEPEIEMLFHNSKLSTLAHDKMDELRKSRL